MAVKHVDPRRAVSYAKGRRKGNEVPALLWLYIILIGLVLLRRGTWPSGPEFVTYGLLAGGVVAAGAVVPTFASAALIALLIAAVLGVVPQLTNVVTRANGAVASALGR